MEQHDKPQSHLNYELLIRLDENVKLLSRDVRDANSAINARIAVVESGKFDKAEAARIMVESEKIHKDHEDRIRKVETLAGNTQTQIKTWGSVAVAGLAILQVILKFVN